MTTSALTVYNTSSQHRTVWRTLLAVCCFMLLSWSMAHAETAIYKFENPEQEKLFYELTAELRCPQCQNNNIAESNAGLSSDMRSKVYEMVLEGKSKQEVVQFMVDRYGNFITYNPPVTASTIILWVAPILSLLAGFIYVMYRSRKTTNITATDEIALEEEKTSTNTQSKKEKSQANNPTKTSFTFIIGAVLFVIVCTGSIFYNTTDWDQIEFEKKALAALPDLKERYATNNFNSVMQVQQLAIGLRLQLQKDPSNADNWFILGQIYDNYMNRPDESLLALEHAYELEPDNINIKGLYAQLLLRTSFQPEDRIKAVELLESVLEQKPNNLSALYWLALYSQSEQLYTKSIPLWEHMLALLPPTSTDRSRIVVHLENDKKAYEQQLQTQP